MKVSDDLNKETFNNVVVKAELNTTLEAMYNHFQNTVKKAQRFFLAKQRAVDVQSIHGVVMKCDVQLCGDDEHVNVWPHSDGIKREGIPLNRGTLALSLTTFVLPTTILFWNFCCSGLSINCICYLPRYVTKMRLLGVIHTSVS